MRCHALRVKSGGLGVDLQQVGSLFLDDIVRVVEAAAALHFAAKARVSRLR